MSQVNTNSIYDASGGSNAVLYGVAAPANSMGFRNRIINGAMVIDQRNAGASVSPMSGSYAIDRWVGSYLGGGTGRFSAQQSSTAPSGFVNSWLITVTTADAAPAAAYGYEVQQWIEGYNIADLGFGTASASPITVSFWVRSSVTGTFPLIIYNGAGTRAFGGTYTINSANTFEYKTVTITGDTSGTWATNNTAGLSVIFGFGGGSGRTLNTGWQAASGSTPTNVTGCTQFIATNGATFYITGVQLEAGSVASPFERRDYGRELMMCCRYYFRENTGGSGYTWVSGFLPVSTIFRSYKTLPVAMRAAPTFGYSTASGAMVCNSSAGNTAINSFAGVVGPLGGNLEFGIGAATAGSGAVIYANTGASSAYFDYSAEL